MAFRYFNFSPPFEAVVISEQVRMVLHGYNVISKKKKNKTITKQNKKKPYTHKKQPPRQKYYMSFLFSDTRKEEIVSLLFLSLDENWH